MKKKQLIIVASLLTLITVVALGVVLLVNREKPKKTLTLETSTSIRQKLRNLHHLQESNIKIQVRRQLKR